MSDRHTPLRKRRTTRLGWTGKAHNIDGHIFDRRESAVRSYCRRLDAVLDTAQGSIVVDTDGHEYIDFLAGAGSLNYGHNDPDLMAALGAHISRNGITHSLDFHTAEKARFLQTFESTVLSRLAVPYRVQFPGPTGTNGVEAAVKLARKVTGRTTVVAFTNGFHGVTIGSLAVTGNRGARSSQAGLLGGVARLPYDGYLGPDVDTADLLDKMLADGSSGLDLPAAILVETVQGEGGINVASEAWLQRIARAAHDCGALLIVDDIQAGCGRTGSFFSFEPAGLEPDIVVLSKSLSGAGLPLTAVLIHPDRDIWSRGEHNGTFRGPNHSFRDRHRGAGEVLVRRHLHHRHRPPFRPRHRSSEHPGQAGARLHGPGGGIMAGVDIGDGEVADRICRAAAHEGLIIETSGARDQVVKIMAPLTTPDDLLDEGFARLERAFHTVLDD